MTAMEDLFALQDEDVLRGQLEYRRARLPEADAVLAAETVRVQMSAEVGDLQIQRLDHARRQNRFEGEVAAIEVRLGELDQRLYGSAITSPKEATALQNEIGSLRRRQDDLEGQILEIMEILEPTDARLEELAAAAIVAAAIVAIDCEGALKGSIGTQLRNDLKDPHRIAQVPRNDQLESSLLERPFLDGIRAAARADEGAAHLGAILLKLEIVVALTAPVIDGDHPGAIELDLFGRCRSRHR